MTPTDFPESNSSFQAPPDYAESQVMTIHAYAGEIERGSLEGAPVVVVAWKPSLDEIERIMAGDPIFLSFIGVLPPHFPSMDFQTAISPA